MLACPVFSSISFCNPVPVFQKGDSVCFIGNGITNGGGYHNNITPSIYDIYKGAVSFTILEKSLPFPVSAAQQPALDLVPFVNDLNREMLTVDGLDAGRYEIMIDGTAVRKASAEDLRNGVNLAMNEKTPQYQQALAVKALNDQRHAAENRLRVLTATWHFVSGKMKGLKQDDEAVMEVVRHFLADAKAKKQEYQIWQFTHYLQDKPKQAEIEKEVQTNTEAMWKRASPLPHHYIIRSEPGQ